MSGSIMPCDDSAAGYALALLTKLQKLDARECVYPLWDTRFLVGVFVLRCLGFSIESKQICLCMTSDAWLIRGWRLSEAGGAHD